MKDLKGRTIRGGFAKLCGQGLNFVLRLFFLVIMARLLDPTDFGLVAMVTVVTGLFGLVSSAGLAMASVQEASITNEQFSTIFWINMLIGIILATLCLATASVLVKFYEEPRLYWVTVTTGVGFVIGAAGLQHCALLQRQMRFVALAVIETLCQLASMTVGIGMAVAGFGYWALVASALAAPAISTVSMWTIAAWVPGLPSRRAKIRSILNFGGTVTLNNLAVYVAYNADKVLLGRFWGAEILGLYGRAYLLVNIPTENLNASIGGVAFSALSRLQNDPIRYKSYFLKGYSLVTSLTFPCTVFCALFADDIVHVVLGPKWVDAASIFRLLTPTILVFGIINPLAWLLLSMGLQRRSLAIALVLAPLTITAYAIGLPFGPTGVASAFSAAMTLFLVPCVLWSVHGTIISPGDILLAISKPLLSAVVATAVALGIQFYFGQLQSPFLRLGLEGTITLVFYFWILLFVMGEKTLYLDLLRELTASLLGQRKTLC